MTSNQGSHGQLRITNLTNNTLVVGGPVGNVGPKAERSFILVYSELEAIRPALLRMEADGSITFTVTSEPNATAANLETDVLTAQDTITAIEEGGGGGGSGGDAEFDNINVSDNTVTNILEANNIYADDGQFNIVRSD